MVDINPILLVRESPDATVLDGRGVSLIPQISLGIAKVQALADDLDAWLAKAIGVAAPAPMREVQAGAVTCAWLAPGEWLLAGPEPDVAALLARCDKAGGNLGLAIDLTHARATFELVGPFARKVLAAHCPLDLSDAEMPVGAAKRSMFSEAGFFLSRKADRDGHPVFQLIFDQTMAGYAVRILNTTIAGVTS